MLRPREILKRYEEIEQRAYPATSQEDPRLTSSNFPAAPPNKLGLEKPLAELAFLDHISWVLFAKVESFSYCVSGPSGASQISSHNRHFRCWLRHTRLTGLRIWKTSRASTRSKPALTPLVFTPRDSGVARTNHG